MFYIQILVVVFIIGWAFGRRSRNATEKSTENLHSKIQQELATTNDPAVQEALTRITGIQNTYTQQNAPVQYAESAPQPLAQFFYTDETLQDTAITSPQPIESPHVEIKKAEAKAYLDNTSLLLYFGAFLFITSVGLFVGFADVTGGLKTAAVGLVAITLYLFGFWMHDTRKKLKIVGEAFVGIGMTTIPFVGVTAYNFGSSQVSGVAIWVATSLIALGLYSYSVMKLGTTFVSYLLVGSIMSLILSFVGIIDGPIYYFIWALALSGIVLQAVSLVFEKIPSLQDASHISGQVFAPLAIAASLFAIPENGTAQIAVTTGLSACYYALLAVSEQQNRKTYAVTAHSLTIATIAIGAFSINESISGAGAVLIAVTLVHLTGIFAFRQWLAKAPEHATVMLATGGFSIVFLLGQPVAATIAIGATLLLSATLTYTQKLLYAFQLSLGLFIALSYAFGQWLPNVSFSPVAQIVLSLVFILPLVVMLKIDDSSEGQVWKESLRGVIASGLLIITFVAFFSGAYPLFMTMIGIAALCALIHRIDRIDTWHYLELIFVSVPFLYGAVNYGSNPIDNYLSITAATLLAASILASLRHKLTAARWLSTATWLVLPIVLISDNIANITSSAESIIWLYGFVVVALSTSRAIALGKFLPHASVPMSSLSYASSVVYFFGALIASFIVAVSSFTTSNNLLAVLALVVLTGYLLVHFGYYEKSNTFAALVPFVAQLILFRVIEPYNTTDVNAGVTFPLISSLIALAGCTYAYSLSSEKEYLPVTLMDIRKVALASMYVAPASFILLQDITWPMPVAALIATVTTLYLYRNERQSMRETLGGAVLASVFWIMFYNGIEDVQVYAHITAALFAFYSYVRHTAGDKTNSNNYVLAALITATVPLALEALGGSERGSILGLWLLLEQIGFLLLGVSIKQPLLTKWGLYVGIAAVMYQLRDLGWAMVAILSLFIIGIAVYRSTKQPEDNE